jgi:hypothetical protein
MTEPELTQVWLEAQAKLSNAYVDELKQRIDVLENENEELKMAAIDVVVRYENLSSFDLVGEMDVAIDRLRTAMGWIRPPS